MSCAVAGAPQYAGGAKDYATPLRGWARESSANLTRAMLAVAYVFVNLVVDLLYGWIDPRTSRS